MRIQSSLQPRPPIRDTNWQEAGRLMADRGIPSENHELLQENLATYLSHRSWMGNLSERWKGKLERELSKPFSDEQVGPRLDALQASLLENVQELPAFPRQIYLTGSFSRGRLGANSDLDGYATLPEDQMSAGFDSFEKRVASDGACLFPLSEERPGFNQANLLYAGASVAINPSKLGESGYLRKVYQHVLDHRQERRETSTVYEWATGKMWGEGLNAKEKREQFEGKTLKSRIMNSVLALGGSLSMVPILGAVVRKAADLAVNQVHLEQPQP